MADLTLSLDDLRNEAVHFLYGDTYANASTAEKAIVDSIVNKGYRQFLYPPVISGADITRWSFLPVGDDVDELDDTHTTPLGAPEHSQLLLESILSIAELHEDDKKGEHWERFVVLLVAGNVRDRQDNKVKVGAVSRDWAGLKAAVAAYAYGEAVADLTTTQDAEVESMVQAGYRRFLFPPVTEAFPEGHEWSFLKVATTIDVEEGEAVQDLPADFGRLRGNITFPPELYTRPVVQISEGHMAKLRQQTQDADRPRYATVRYKESDGSTAQGQEVVWWPVPNDDYTLNYSYDAYTGDLSDLFTVPLGGHEHFELIVKSCLAVTHDAKKTGRNIHYEQFTAMLAAAIHRDLRRGAKFFGQMGGCEHDMSDRPLRTPYPITYKTHTW